MRGAVQLPWVLALCSAPSRSRAGNMVLVCAWENVAYCPLSNALGTGSGNMQSFNNKWRKNRNLGRNLDLPAQGITHWGLERNFPNGWTVLGLPPTSSRPSLVQWACWLTPPLGVSCVPPSGLVTVTLHQLLYGETRTFAGIFYIEKQCKVGPGCPKVPAAPGVFPWKFTHPGRKQFVLSAHARGEVPGSVTAITLVIFRVNCEYFGAKSVTCTVLRTRGSCWHTWPA